MLKYHIQTIEVGASGAATIDFTNIPQTYDDLEIVMSSRGNTGAHYELQVTFNGSTTGFSSRQLYGTGSSAASSAPTNRQFGLINGSALTANTFSSGKVLIPNYRSSNAKSYSVNSVTETNATEAYQAILAGLWSGTSAITSISFQGTSGSFVQYTSASLYGIKHGVDGVVEAAADGGAITQSGGYTIHTFTSSGTFVANRDMDVEYVVVAGGGGGARQSGGGGAGGYRSSVVGESSGGGSSAENKLRITSGTSYLVEVGAGGSGGSTLGASGSSSALGPILSVGGGRAGQANTSFVSGANGGSGGGGWGASGLGGSPTSNQGYAGGAGNGTDPASAGGGGGASSVGVDATTSSAGNGGSGITSSITGSSIGRGGGGGGGAVSSRTAGTATDGGGNGTNTNTGAAGSGTANTGGGGGGSGYVQGSSNTSTGGNGGSGVVIIRYPTPA